MHRQTFRENHLNAPIGKDWLERTIPDRPQSRLQRLQTTDEGKKWLHGGINQGGNAQMWNGNGHQTDQERYSWIKPLLLQ